MVTQAMKLLVHSVCADVNARGDLQLCSNLLSRGFVIFKHRCPRSVTLQHRARYYFKMLKADRGISKIEETSSSEVQYICTT